MTLARVVVILSLASVPAAAAPRDADGLTPLHVAAGRGDETRVAELLRAGADVHALDSKMGVSVLHKAVYSGSPKAVELLLRHGALLNLQSPSNGNTPLHDAIYFKPGADLRVIRALLSHKPSLSIRNRAGLTPLDSARVLKDRAVLALLEAQVRSRFTPAGRALMEAVKANDLSRVQQILRGTVNIEEPDDQGFTALLWAAREGRAEVVKVLLERGASPNRNDEWMHANAGHKAAFWGRAEVMSLLVRHRLDVNARGGYNGYTALHDAVARGHVVVARILLRAGARTDIRGHDGKRPIDLATAAKNAALVQLLQAAARSLTTE
jgi:uncharacterized protein